MKKLALFLFVFLLLFLSIKSALAEEINITNINVFDVSNGRATIKWNTNIGTKGEIYYGKSREELSNFIGYSLYDTDHESSFSGLEIDETYYFKIIAIDIFGNRSESFIQNFDTDDMKDTTAPIMLDHKVVQVIWDSIMLNWTTDEKTKADIYYGFSEGNMNKKVSYSSYDKDHIKIVSKLIPNSTYYMKIVAKDKGGNTTNTSFIFNTGLKPGVADQSLKLKSIEPISSNSPLISSRYVKIKAETNWASRMIVYYGKSSKDLNKNIKDLKVGIDHEVLIDNLEPNTMYYFKVKIYDTFYDKTKTTDILNFKTKSLETNLKTGDIVKGSLNIVYIIQGNNKAWIENENIFTGLGYRWNMIKEVSDETLARYNDINNISNTRKHPDGTLFKYEDSPSVYILENKKKRPFISGEAFERAGYSWNDIIEIDKKKWTYGTGENIN